MSDNPTNMADGSGDRDPELYVAIVALVISVIALIGTLLQVVQQYLASAAGYSNCDENVIGEWSKSKRRVFRWDELRFEVQFEAPVIFVCPPKNQQGPVKDAKVLHLEGTEESQAATRVRIPSSALREQLTVKTDKGIHTADNEQATWIVLLQELHRMERDSQDWAAGQYKENPPRDRTSQFSDHSMCVAVQAKQRSWDTMPPNIKKPYATTTMCHLIEMAAMLGLYWKEFDRSKDKYRAEGNGYVMTGTNVSELGIVFTFQICGKRTFGENRIVPNDDVKELAFGYVPTIFADGSDSRRLEFPTEESRDLSILQLGSANDFAETLVSFGCNTGASNCVRDNSKRHSHLFPLAFEILGMLGRTLHVRNSCFRVLPNPTYYHWDKKYFSTRKLLQEYKKRIKDDDLIRIESEQIGRLQNLAERVDKKLRGLKKQTSVSLELLDTLHDALDRCDHFLQNDVPTQMVELVLREHVQEVLRMINNEDEDAYSSEEADAATERDGLRFDNLMTAAPEERQEKLMDIYFSVVLPRVLDDCNDHLRRSKTSFLSVPRHARSTSHSSSLYSATPSLQPSRSPSPTPEAGQVDCSAPQLLLPMSSDDVGGGGAAYHLSEKQATNVWCTLVFRMLCWLQLHDFHKRDVQISKSEQRGSRLPVYIA